MKTNIIFYIDPQSSGNLSAYDYGVLSKVNSTVCYICSRYYDYKEMSPNIHPYPIFKYNHIKNPVFKLFSYLCSMLRLLLLLIKQRPCIVHVQWLRVPHFDYAFYRLVRRFLHPVLILTAHNLLPHNTGNRYKNIYYKVYHLFDHIIVHAQTTQDEICNRFHINIQKTSVIHHGTLKMVADQEKLKRQEHIFKQKYLTEGVLVFTSLGEQSRYKGIDLLVEIWNETPALHDNQHLRLILAGKNNGIDYSPIKHFSNVIIVNKRISNEEYLYLLHLTDVFLLPYRTISQSGALFTAMEEGIPILVSDAGGLSEPLAIANIGWKVRADDKESLRQMLIHLVSHPYETRRMKNNKQCWETVCAKYSWNTISIQTQDLYHKLTKSL